MLDIAGGILIASAIMSVIAFGIYGLSEREDGAGFFILMGLIGGAAVIFHSYLGELISHLMA